MTASELPRVRALATTGLTGPEIEAIRALLWAAFATDGEGFTEDDWQHALGGRHFVAEHEGRIVSHAAVVERPIEFGRTRIRAGYVEAVATASDRQGRGHGTLVMRAVGDHIRDGFEIGVLGTGSHGFYERLGWTTWRGRSFVRTADAGLVATPDDDGCLMVLRTPTTPPLDPDAPIVCDWRPGDVW